MVKIRRKQPMLCSTMWVMTSHTVWGHQWHRPKLRWEQPMAFMLAYGLLRWTVRGHAWTLLLSVAFAFGVNMHKVVFGATMPVAMLMKWWLTTKSCLSVVSRVVTVIHSLALLWMTEDTTGKSLMVFSPFLLSQAWQRGFPKEQPSLATFLLAPTSTWAQVRNTIIKERKLLALGIIWVTKTSCQPIVGW